MAVSAMSRRGILPMTSRCNGPEQGQEAPSTHARTGVPRHKHGKNHFMPDISPHSIVEKGAKLARDVRVGPFCYVGPNVHIGPGCVLHNNVTVVGRTTLGEQNHVFPLAVIGLGPDGEGARGKCVIGNANSIREHVTIYGGTSRCPTRIGQDNLLMIASQVGAGATLGDHGIFANCTHIAAHAVFEDYVRTSAWSTVEEGVTVGAYTFIAGYVHVDRDAPPYAMIQGTPFRVRGVNSHNLKQCGFGEDDIRQLKRIFREVFNGNGTMKPQAVDSLQDAVADNPHLAKLADYLRKAGQQHDG